MMKALAVGITLGVMYVVLYLVGKAVTYPLRAINYYLNRWIWNGFRWGIYKVRKIEFKPEWPPILVRMFQLILIGLIISFLASWIGNAMGISDETNVFVTIGTQITTIGFLLEFVSILVQLLPIFFRDHLPFSLSVALGYKALARVPEFASTSDLIAVLKTENSWVRIATSDTLKKRGQSIIPELVIALQSEDESFNASIVEILDAIDPKWKAVSAQVH